ncbi:MAG TPA: hypothetical protein DDZ51_16935, partial [Planctomycetaceae bacterium]|nr:hypothetical protein [Planctomycetaceae bacterium]
LELRQIQIEESVQTSKLQSEIIVQTAFDRALVEHHSELQEIRAQNDEQTAVSLIRIFESKASSEQRLRSSDSPLAQRALEASNAMHIATAQRIVNRSDE